MALDVELAFFEESRRDWLNQHRGKFAVVKDETLLGFYDTPELALQAGLREWGHTSFLIKPVLPSDPVEQIPALVHGLIHAHS